MPESLFIEVDYCQLACKGQNLAGDVFLSQKLDEGRRMVSVLADGLGHGVQAAAPASLTAAMALEYVAWNIDTAKAATILMDSLPVEPRRHISHSTFTIVDAHMDGRTRVFEHGNPPFLLLRDGEAVPVERRLLGRPRWGNRILQVSEFETNIGDRILLYSDGVTQAGMGTEELPLGWGEPEAQAFILERLRQYPALSARRLAEVVVDRAVGYDGGLPGDDITCGILCFRHPRQMYVITGPPYEESRDPEYARLVEEPGVKKVVCGGTTSNIVARELRREIEMDLSEYDREVPMPSHMEGVELVTEGCLTLGKLGDYLEFGPPPHRRNAATRLMELLLESDVISFQVGTRVNQAHQDPTLPIELDIRRNVIKRLAGLLEAKYLKKVHVTYY